MEKLCKSTIDTDVLRYLLKVILRQLVKQGFYHFISIFFTLRENRWHAIAFGLTPAASALPRFAVRQRSMADGFTLGRLGYGTPSAFAQLGFFFSIAGFSESTGLGKDFLKWSKGHIIGGVKFCLLASCRSVYPTRTHLKNAFYPSLVWRASS